VTLKVDRLIDGSLATIPRLSAFLSLFSSFARTPIASIFCYGTMSKPKLLTVTDGGELKQKHLNHLYTPRDLLKKLDTEAMGVKWRHVREKVTRALMMTPTVRARACVCVCLEWFSYT